MHVFPFAHCKKMAATIGIPAKRECIDLTNETDNDLTNTNSPSTVCVSFKSFEMGQKKVEVTFSYSNDNNQLAIKKQKTGGEDDSSTSSVTPSPSPTPGGCSGSGPNKDYERLMDYAVESETSASEVDLFASKLPTFHYLGDLDPPSRAKKWVERLDSAISEVGYDRYRLFLPEIENTLSGTAIEWWKQNVHRYPNWLEIKQAFIKKYLNPSPHPPQMFNAGDTLSTNNNCDNLVHSSAPKAVNMTDSEINTSRRLFTMSVVVGAKVLNCLLDSASDVNLITLRAVELVGLLNQTKHLDSKHSPTFSKRYNALLSSSVNVPIEFPGYGETEVKHSSRVYVSQTLDQYDLILGLPFIRQHAQAINWTTHTFYHRKTAMNKDPFLLEVV